MCGWNTDNREGGVDGVHTNREGYVCGWRTGNREGVCVDGVQVIGRVCVWMEYR